jgi:hypothetical protein
VREWVRACVHACVRNAQYVSSGCRYLVFLLLFIVVPMWLRVRAMYIQVIMYLVVGNEQ